MHLPTRDLLLGLRHGAHLEVLRPTGTRPYDDWEGHRAVLGFIQLVELLLQKGRPRRQAGGEVQPPQPPPRQTPTPTPVKPVLLLGGHGVLQHGGFLVSFQAKVVFALFLQVRGSNHPCSPRPDPETAAEATQTKSEDTHPK